MNHFSLPVPIHAVLFDLDGTLLDTAPDLASALNALLTKNKKSPLPFEEIRKTVSQGGAALTRLGFPEVTDETAFENLRQDLLRIYAESICIDSGLFEEMEDLLNTIENEQVPWGIVTNKPGWLTTPLLQQLDLLDRAACVVSGDTLPHRKPLPDPLLHACKQLGLSPTYTLYIGDDPRDIYAGNAAGMYTCVASYGYIEPSLEIDRWGADFAIASPGELIKFIQLTKNINDVGT